MKKVIIKTFLISIFISCNISKPIKFVKLSVDDRGLVSCQYIEKDGDTVGLDYMSNLGLKMLLKGNIKKVYKR